MDCTQSESAWLRTNSGSDLAAQPNLTMQLCRLQTISHDPVVNHLGVVLDILMGLGLELNHQSRNPFFFSLLPPMPTTSLRLGMSCRVGSSPSRGWVSSLSGSPVRLLGLDTSSGCRGATVVCWEEDLRTEQQGGWARRTTGSTNRHRR